MVMANEKKCPRCGYPILKKWEDLTADEKFFAERLPMSADYTAEQRKRHRFCTRCWFEAEDDGPVTV
jgi:ribosomal protein S27AE